METPTERFQRIIGPVDEAEPNTPQRRRCSGIKRNGERCGAWAVTGNDKCAGHLKLVPLDSAVGVAGRRKAAEKRRRARLSLADRLTAELEEDSDAVVNALKAGLRAKSETVRVRSAQAWISLIYGRQLQGRGDEASELDVVAMSQEELATLKAKLAREHPALAASILGRVS